MSLAHVLLTSLIEKPSTGIELARRFDQSMGFFWNATHQQIYRELGLMLDKNWISTVSNEDPDSRKKTYQVEELGKKRLNEWLIEQSQPAKLRDELMVKLRAEAQLGGNQIMPEIQRHIALHQAQLKIYQTIFERDQIKSAASEDQRAAIIQQKVLELGIQLETGWVNWLEEVVTLLQQNKNE